MNNTPIVLGWPQLIIFIIGLVGLGLLISSVMGLRGRRVHHPYRTEEEARRAGWYDRPEHRHRRRPRWGRSIGGVLLLLVAIGLLWLASLMQTYLGLTGDIQVARVRAVPTQLAHTMSVELILYDNSGKPKSDDTYIVLGDEWMLQGDIIKYPSWANILGLHSGYKLTRLEGRFDDSDMERHSQHSVVDLNGGDDNFFKTVQHQAWVNPMIEAAYGNAVFLAADRQTYNVFVSQTGLYAKPAK